LVPQAAWSKLCKRVGMREGWRHARNARLKNAARRSVEYAIAVGIAFLSGYWIVQWRW